MKFIRWVAIAASLCLLSACSNKPPGCADEEVVSLFRSMILEDESQTSKELREADKAGHIKPFVDAAKVTLTNVVSDGYSEQAKRQSCKATVAVTMPDGNSWTLETPYTTQLTVDGKGKFLLEAEGIGQLTFLARNAVQEHYLNSVWGGVWSGTYSCSGLDGETSGPRGPFSLPVEMVVEGKETKLERLTAGGGVETLTGLRPGVDGDFGISGRGRNSEDDRWEIVFKGKLEGGTVTAQGVSRTGGFDDRVLRKCTIQLKKGAAATGAPPIASAQGVSTGWPGIYVGVGDGEVTLEVKPQGADKRFPVSLSTSTAKTGGGCGGAVQGLGIESGGELRIVAEADGQRCEAIAKRKGAAIELEEGPGCNYFHGAACGFSAELNKVK